MTDYITSFEGHPEVQEPSIAYMNLKLGYSSMVAYRFIVDSYIKTVDLAAQIFGVSTRTIKDWGRKETKLNTLYGDTLVELQEIQSAGSAAFESAEDFDTWLHSSLFAFGDRKPIEFLDNTIGRKMVLNQLIAYEHGMFA